VWAVCRHSDAHAPHEDVVEWDLGSPDVPASLPPRVETVIHLAQSNWHHQFPARANDIFSVNLAAVARLLDWSQRVGVKRFVLGSSGNADLAQTYYLACKRAAELLAECYRQHFVVVTLRFFFVYGPGQRSSMLIPRLVESVRSGQPITLDGHDGVRLNPIHVTDAAAAVQRAAALDHSARMDVAGPEVHSLRWMAERIGDAVGKRPVFAVNAGASAPTLVGDLTDMTRWLGAPTIRFEDGIRDVCGAAEWRA
jgi:nucleoside-diphosphate-sugar epimerase